MFKNDPKPHQFSWRYDQMYDCLPNIGDKAITNLPKSMKKLYPNPNCCISIEVDWLSRPITEVLCSQQKKEDICLIEMKLLRASIYRYCVKSTIKEMLNIMKASGNKKPNIYAEMKLKYGRVIKYLPKYIETIKSPIIRLKMNKLRQYIEKLKEFVSIPKDNKKKIQRIQISMKEAR